MKLRLIFRCAFVAMLFAIPHASAVVLEYKMGTLSPTAVSSDLAGGDLTPDVGLSLFNPMSTTITSANDPQDDNDATLSVNFMQPTLDLATANSTNSWFTFDVTVGAGVADFDISSLSLNATRGATSEPRGFAIYSTTNGGTEVELRGDTTLPTARPIYGDPFVTDLTGFASLQDLEDGDVVSFRIPLYTTGQANTVDFDNILLDGTGVAAIPGDPDPMLDGDYNGDNRVDAADYAVWRNGDSPDSSVDGYNLWRANYGAPGNAAQAAAAAPEPASLALFASLALLGVGARRRL